MKNIGGERKAQTVSVTINGSKRTYKSGVEAKRDLKRRVNGDASVIRSIKIKAA